MPMTRAIIARPPKKRTTSLSWGFCPAAAVMVSTTTASATMPYQIHAGRGRGRLLSSSAGTSRNDGGSGVTEVTLPKMRPGCDGEGSALPGGASRMQTMRFEGNLIDTFVRGCAQFGCSWFLEGFVV